MGDTSIEAAAGLRADAAAAALRIDDVDDAAPAALRIDDVDDAAAVLDSRCCCPAATNDAEVEAAAAEGADAVVEDVVTSASAAATAASRGIPFHPSDLGFNIRPHEVDVGTPWTLFQLDNFIGLYHP